MLEEAAYLPALKPVGARGLPQTEVLAFQDVAGVGHHGPPGGHIKTRCERLEERRPVPTPVHPECLHSLYLPVARNFVE